MCNSLVVLLVLFTFKATFSQNAVENSRGAGYQREQDPRKASLTRRPCDVEQLEYRLTRLEVQVGEKSENLRSELREGNRRLQALEYQCTEVHSALESFRNELGRYTEVGQQPYQQMEKCESSSRLEKRIDNLAKGVQIFVAALKVVTSDIGWITKNVSNIVNTTSLLLHHQHHLVTKQFLTNSLVDIKVNQLYHQVPSNYVAKPENGNAIPKNCKEVMNNGKTETGIYLIQPNVAAKPFMALCNMDDRDGGWTYIHNRFEGSQDFFLDMHDYKFGFGNIGGEFWLGLEKIHLLTGSEVNELLVELVDVNNEKAHAHYSAFSVGSEVEGYSLKVLGGYSGDAGDSLIYHAGSRFSTKDLDQDGWPEGNCASAHGGAWWYRGCDTSNLNGKYLNGELPETYLYQGMYWQEFRGAQYSLAQARMMVRPRDHNSSPILPGGIVK